MKMKALTDTIMRMETDNKLRYFPPVMSLVSIEMESCFAASIHIDETPGATDVEDWEVEDKGNTDIFI